MVFDFYPCLVAKGGGGTLLGSLFSVQTMFVCGSEMYYIDPVTIQIVMRLMGDARLRYACHSS